MNGATRVAALIDRIGRTVHGAGFSAGLNPAQWSALRYFGQANRFSRTVSAFAAHHGTSLGTASKTVKALVDKGLLDRRADGRDRRRLRLEPSDAGRRALRGDPAEALERAAGELPEIEQAMVVRALEAILDEVAGRDESGRFGVCSACRHLCRSACAEGGSPRYSCVLAGESLERAELGQLCVNYQH